MTEHTDLHLHTWYSDGSLSPAQVVAWAKEQGLTTIAITDHDGMEGIPEALEAGRKSGVKVIPGIEFSCKTRDGFGVHILGYDIDINNPQLQAVCTKMNAIRRKRNEKLMEVLQRKKIKISWDDFENLPGRGYVGKPDFARLLTEKGYLNSPKEAFLEDGVFSDMKIRRLKKDKLEAESAIELIKHAGGWASLAHPMKINRLGERGEEDFYGHLEELVSHLSAAGLTALECVYPEHTDEEMVRLTLLAHKLGLKVTGGSDWHGPEFDV